jgi:hypothetical protein
MKVKPKIWFVDDLPENLATFENNHEAAFDIETFSAPAQVWERVARDHCPDALLVDVFFYDSLEQARRAESEVAELVDQLQEQVRRSGISEEKYKGGIKLIEQIHHHFRGRTPFPVYAYTSKGPVLLDKAEWQTLSQCGAKVLLKTRITPESERAQILADIRSFAPQNRSVAAWLALTGILTLCVTLLLGRWIRGNW